jgi:hypothetical protein
MPEDALVNSSVVQWPHLDPATSRYGKCRPSCIAGRETSPLPPVGKRSYVHRRIQRHCEPLP